MIRIQANTRRIDSALFPALNLSLYTETNKGFEGIACNPEARRFTVVKERSPTSAFEISYFSWDNATPTGITINRADHIDAKRLSLDDFSGLHLSKATGNLLILSQESQRLAEVTPLGDQVSFLVLSRGFSGLLADIPQAEEVTLDDQGTLYVVSEPNLFYRFKKTAPHASPVTTSKTTADYSGTASVRHTPTPTRGETAMTK